MFEFAREWLTNYHDTGAVAPSSRYLARMIVSEAKVTGGTSVLELGPGTGAFTQTILEACPHSGPERYLGIEINPRFHRALESRFQGLQFELGSAADFDLGGHTSEFGLFDAVVSGLPWVSFSPELQIAILDNVLPHIRPGGTFTTFAYTGPHLRIPGRRFRRLLSEKFRTLRRTRTVLLNLPPAFVYVAEV